MNSKEIPEYQWDDFLKSFSRQHFRWRSYIEIFNNEGVKNLLSENKPLKNIFYNKEQNLLKLEMEDTDEISSEFKINNIKKIFVEEKEEGVHKGLKILTGENKELFLRFRSTLPNDMLDGLVR